MQNSMRIGVEVTSSLDNVRWDYVAILTADFQPIEIFVRHRHGVDDVTYPIGRKDMTESLVETKEIP